MDWERQRHLIKSVDLVSYHKRTIDKIHNLARIYCVSPIRYMFHRADSSFAPSQWGTALLCNDLSHWLGANLESALHVPCRESSWWHHDMKRLTFRVSFDVFFVASLKKLPVKLLSCGWLYASYGSCNVTIIKSSPAADCFTDAVTLPKIYNLL